GKIFHELSTSGIVHYDAADATPLYIVLAGRYLRHSGDTAFIRASWPNILKAIDFCYSTDTDGDLLIENTNVGHGWVEGGHLFGSHTSLHLASVWAAALEEAAYMASHLDLSEKFVRFNQDAHRVREIINRDFWNAQNDYYYHGLMADGTYMEETSIMPAIPMLFGQADLEKADKVLPVIASNAFTADWGCRIVPEHDPRFNPRGYHTGSVWPLFTGWASLAEFRNNNYLQGFAHLSSNLEIWKYWGLGFMEEVLNGEVFQPSGVCHHQCWSETMALQPVIEGMLGYRPDAVNRKIYLKPWFPADWESMSVKGIRVGEEKMSMLVQSSRFKVQSYSDEVGSDKVDADRGYGARGIELNGAMNVTRFSFAKKAGERLDVHLQPVLPPGCKVEKITVNGLPARDWGLREARQGWVIPEFGFWLDSTAVVEITWYGGITALPLLSHPVPGERSKGFRFIGTRYDNETYTVILQAPRASRQEFRVWAAEPEKYWPEGAEIINISGHIITLAADFPDLETDYAVKYITLEYISD
ncbi:MAG: hypothetical protein K0B08_07555, partial [Bacteroidales bacterium]|nr:hypothetical protein [Bacteroidales bacterium]